MKNRMLLLMMAMILGTGAILGSDCRIEADTDDDDLDEIFKPVVTSQVEGSGEIPIWSALVG